MPAGSWKEHVASSMRGKKFANRADANAFMRKLSAEWKSSKGGQGTEPLRPIIRRGAGHKGLSASAARALHKHPELLKPWLVGMGMMKNKDMAEESETSSDGEDDQEQEVETSGGRLYGLGNTELLLRPGLGDGCHLSVLPK